MPIGQCNMCLTLHHNNSNVSKREGSIQSNRPPLYLNTATQTIESGHLNYILQHSQPLRTLPLRVELVSPRAVNAPVIHFTHRSIIITQRLAIRSSKFAECFHLSSL